MLYLTNINLNGNELQNAIIQPLAAAPANPKLGQIYYNSTTYKLMQYNGSEWQPIGAVISKSNTPGSILVDGVEMSIYELPVASNSKLGGIIAGPGLSVSADGRLSVNVINSLDSESVSDPLSAYRGKVLNDAINDILKSLDSFYNKEEVNDLVRNIPKMKVEVVEELPTENISTETIYLIVQENSQDVHDEYIYVDGVWELIGSTRVDLEGYIRDEDIAVVATSGNYEDLNNRILRVSGTIFAGATETIINVGSCVLHSIESFDAATGERVIVDANITGEDLHVTIASAHENDLNISVLLSLI